MNRRDYAFTQLARRQAVRNFPLWAMPFIAILFMLILAFLSDLMGGL